MPQDAMQTLSALGMDENLVAELPPDLRDLLLEYVATFGDADELLELATQLRQVHGPLLYLLDSQAEALFALERYAEALDLVERRLRRSSAIHTQALEALTHLRMGHIAHAASLAADLGAAYPRSWSAQRVAAQLAAAQGDFAAAEEILQDWLGIHPGDPSATLTLAQFAHEAVDIATADEMLDRLGSGVPADLPDAELAPLHSLLLATGRSESTRAVASEVERRRQIRLEHLIEQLRPWTSADPGLRVASQRLFRSINGPDSIPMSRDEQRGILLEAARNFGFSSLREGQAETIVSLLRGESMLAVMPTGAGKSLCYQLPALTLPRTSLIISPLIALMKDQVDGLPVRARELATFINSTLSDEEMADRLKGISEGRYRLVYAAPERLRQRDFLHTLREAGLDLFVIDEAHCVSLWGHDFRPDYLFLQEARRELGSPTTLAMTATAPPRVRDEILDHMRAEPDARGSDARETGAAAAARAPRVLTLDIFRHNLFLSAHHFSNEDEKLQALLELVGRLEGSGIIYVNTRRKCEALTWALRDAGHSAEAYHAGLDNRAEIQDRFMSDKTRIIVATVAFGMGIDKSDIRFIIHFHPSRSLAGYYQEVGRAGRDGKPSQGILFHSASDWANLRRWARSDETEPAFLRRVYDAIIAQLSPESTPHSKTVSGLVDARRLQHVLDEDDTTVRVAIGMLERCDLLSRGFDVAQDVTITLARRITDDARNDADFRDFVRHSGLRPGAGATFKLPDMAGIMGWSASDFETVLLEWRAKGYLTAAFSRRAMSIDIPPMPADFEARLQRLLAQSLALSQRRLDDMIGYATTESCRHGYISAHFGSPPRSHCDVCDNCTGVRIDLPKSEPGNHIIPEDGDIGPIIIDCLISLPRPLGRSGLARVLVANLRAPVGPDKARHHGALKAMSEGAVLESIDELIESSRLRKVDRDGYSVLAPTLSGRLDAEAWRSEQPERNSYGPAPIEADAETADPDVEQPLADMLTYTDLQRALWNWRRRVAEDLGQPAYVVLSYELLLRIAETRPQTIEHLGELPGMGVQRLNHYGPTIMDFIRLHPAAPGDDERLLAQRRALTEARGASSASSSRERTSAQPVPASPRIERALYLKLQEVRQKLAVNGRIRVSEVASNTLLKEIARYAPSTLAELDQIPGFRSSALRNEGPQILTFVAALRSREDSSPSS